MELKTQGTIKLNGFHARLQTNKIKLRVKGKQDRNNPEYYLDAREKQYWDRLPAKEKQKILLKAKTAARNQTAFGKKGNPRKQELQAHVPYPYRVLEQQKQKDIQESFQPVKKTAQTDESWRPVETKAWIQKQKLASGPGIQRKTTVYGKVETGSKQRAKEGARPFSQSQEKDHGPERDRGSENPPVFSSQPSGSHTKSQTVQHVSNTGKSEQTRQAAVHTGQTAESTREAAATAASGGISMAVDVAKKAAGIVKNNFSAAMYKEEEQRKVSCEAILSESGQSISKTPEKKLQRAVAATVAMVTVMVQTMFGTLLSTLVILGVLLSVLTGILSFIFGGASTSGYAQANVSEACERYRPLVEQYAAQYGMEDYVELTLAVMMQESGGLLPDVMQASEGAFNTRYPRVPNGITDPEYSIECGVQELKYALDKAGCTGPTDMEKIKLALQGYNYGPGYIDWALSHYGGYSEANAAEFSDMMAAKMGWSAYGDKKYVEHVLRYYQVVSGGFAETPEGGMRIPLYDQKDYANVPYGGGSIASSGCGPTSFAMVASYLLDREITPVDAIWCGNAYYVPGAGTSWSYFQGAADHFGIRLVGTTTDPNTVMQALSEGKPVISSQRPGLFTSGGHFIVLRGITADGKILVNDPNDSPSKNYVNREFDMMREIHATSACYWIFDR